MRSSHLGRAGAATLLAAVSLAATAATAASAWAQPSISVYPLAGSKYNRAQTQIAFRGLPASAIRQVQVTDWSRARTPDTSRPARTATAGASSRPSVRPGGDLTVTENHAPAAGGDTFVAPQSGPSRTAR